MPSNVTLHPSISMEDCNMLAADCVVISCCCQCLMLQLFIFIFIKLPSKIVRRTRKFARKKLGLIGCRNKAKKGRLDHIIRVDEIERIQVVQELDNGNCMEQVERILEELSQKGEFSFGSFWGRNSSSTCIHDHVDKQDINIADFGVVQLELVELLHSFPCSN